MSRTRTAVTNMPAKDPSKMSKSELFSLYKATLTEKEDANKKRGPYPRVSRPECQSYDATNITSPHPSHDPEEV